MMKGYFPKHFETNDVERAGGKVFIMFKPDLVNTTLGEPSDGELSDKGFEYREEDSIDSDNLGQAIKHFLRIYLEQYPNEKLRVEDLDKITIVKGSVINGLTKNQLYELYRETYVKFLERFEQEIIGMEEGTEKGRKKRIFNDRIAFYTGKGGQLIWFILNIPGLSDEEAVEILTDARNKFRVEWKRFIEIEISPHHESVLNAVHVSPLDEARSIIEG